MMISSHDGGAVSQLMTRWSILSYALQLGEPLQGRRQMPLLLDLCPPPRFLLISKRPSDWP